MSNLSGALSLGEPVFTLDGRLLGITMMRKAPKTGGGMGFSMGDVMPVILPADDVADVAQQALASEMSRRGLKLQPEEPAPPLEPVLDPDSPYADSPYAEDRELVEVRTVWSLSDAIQLQALLDGAGIPFFMGPEKATSASAVTSNFANGVSVKIMSVGVPWANRAMMNYAPENEPAATAPMSIE